MTDPQIMDEMSPARVELADPIGSPFESALAPAGGRGRFRTSTSSCAT